MKLSFSTFYNTNCFWEFRRPSPLSSRAKSQGRFEGMCMSCRPVDIHPVEGNKLKAKLCCLVSPMLLLLSAFFLASQLLRFNALLCVKCFHFAFCLFSPPPTAACLQSDVVKSTFISGNATTSPSLFAIWHLISLFFRSISYFLPCFIFLLGFLSKHGLLLVFGLWFLIFGLCLRDDVSDLSIYRDHDSEKSLQRGWEPWTSIHSGKIQPRSLDRKFLINLRWNIKFALSLTVY